MPRDAQAEDELSEASAVPGVGRRFAAFDCIVDVGAEEPRIVFLRDVSLLETARILARAESQPSTEAQPLEGRGAMQRDSESDSSAESRPPVRGAAPMNSVQSRPSRVAEPRPPATMEPPPARRARTAPAGRDVRVGSGAQDRGQTTP